MAGTSDQVFVCAFREVAAAAAAAPAAGDSAAAAPADLGVLLVHGIGDQREGETLLAFGEPLIDYIVRTVTRTEASRLDYVHVSDATLLPSRRLESRTAWAQIDLRIPLEQVSGDGAPFNPLDHQRQTWLVTEAWWGEQVVAPAPLTLIGWLMTRGPWVALAHILARSRRKIEAKDLPAWMTRHSLLMVPFKAFEDGDNLASFAWSTSLFLAGLVFVWLPLATLMQTGLLVLAMLALVPIPRFGRLISAFLLRVSGVLGDSYVLVQHEAQRAAIVSRTRQAIVQLRAKCSRMAIVAHSQGTAVIYDALRSGAPRPDLLVTFGSGLAKLEMLRIGERLRRSSLTATGWVAPLTLAALLIWIRHDADPDLAAGMSHWVVALRDRLAGSPGRIPLAAMSAFVLASAALLCLLAGLDSIVRASRVLKAQRQGEAQSDAKLAGRWLDVCATHDPVPNEALGASLARPDIEFVSVINRSSFVSDHTSYFDNRAEFVPLVAQALCDAAGLQLAGASHALELEQARKHHVSSVHVLAWTRTACAAGVPVLGWLYWGRLRTGGQEWLASAGATLPIKAADVDRALDGFLPWIRAVLGGGFDRQSAVALSMLAAGGAALWLWRHAYGPLWRWWDRVLIDDTLKGTATLGGAVLLAAPFVVVLGMLPLLLAALAVNGVAIEGAILNTFGWMVVALVLISLAVLTFGAAFLAFENRGTLGRLARRLADRATDPRESWAPFAGLAVLWASVVVSAALPSSAPDLRWADVRQALPIILPWTLGGIVVLLGVRLGRHLKRPR